MNGKISVRRAAGRQASFLGCGMLLAILILTGCLTTTMSLRPQVNAQDLAPAHPIPVRVGVYFSPEFQNLEVKRGTTAKLQLAIGEVSRDLLYPLLLNTFEQAEFYAIDQSPLAVATDFDAVLEVSIEGANFRMGLDSDDPQYNVTYRFTFFDRHLVPSASWTVMGNGEPPLFGNPERYVEADLRAAATRIVEQIGARAEDGRAAFLRAAGLERAAPPAVRSGEVALSIRVEAFGDDAAQQEAFGVSTGSPKVAGMRVHIINGGGSAVSVLPWAARLIPPSGRLIAPAGLALVLSELERPRMDGVVAGAAIGGLLGALVTVSEESHQRRELMAREQTLAASLLQEAEIAPGASASGLLAFLPVHWTPSFSDATLRLWFRSADGTMVYTDAAVAGLW